MTYDRIDSDYPNRKGPHMTSLTTTAEQLIRISSTTGNPAALHEALAIIEKLLGQQPNITIERFESNGKPSLLAYIGKERPAKFRVLLNGHVDVVPGKEEQFTPTVKNGRLYGRGTLDMKTAALALTRVFMQTAHALPYPLGLQIVTDEETGGEHGTAYQLAQGVTTEFAIAGEFTPLGAICNESRGLAWVEVDFQGVAAHSAYPWNGTNAILLAHEFIRKLGEAIPTPDSEQWCTTANVAMISTPNITFNSVPDQAKVALDIRYIASDQRFASSDTVVDFLQSLAPKNSTVRLKKFKPSHFADPTNADLHRLAESVAATTGQPATFIRKHGASDIRFFSQRGIPGVTMGLQGEGLHSDGEYVEIDSIERYITTLTMFLQKVA